MWRKPEYGKEQQKEQDTVCTREKTETKDYLNYDTICPLKESEKKVLEEIHFGTDYLLCRGRECEGRNDHGSAVYFYKAAAEKGDLEAMQWLVSYFGKRSDSEHDLYQALEWCCRIMLAGTEDVSEWVDELYRKIINIRRNNNSGFKNITQAGSLRKDYFSVVEKEISKDNIKNIFFVLEMPADIRMRKYYDVSVEGNQSVFLWTEKNGDGYDLYISGTGIIEAPEDSSLLFAGYTQVQYIICRKNFRTDHVKNMASMFSGCRRMIGVDISFFDTKSVENMSGMFFYCEQLKNVDFRNFHTENVTNMSFMFSNCKKLEELNLSSFNTIHVENMSSMFLGCEQLKKLDISSFDTKNTKYKNCMYLGCTNLR